MSAIGDYVHYWQNHYQLSGINRLNEGQYKGYDFKKQEEAITTQRSTNKLNDNELSIIEDNLNYILSTGNGSQKIGDQTVNEIQQAVIEALQENFGQVGLVKWDSGDIVKNPVTTKDLTDQQRIILTNVKKIKNDLNRQINTIYQRITSIEATMDNIKNRTTKANVESQISNIKQTFFNLLDTTENNLQNLLGIDKKITFSQYFKQKGFENKDSSQISNLIEDLNDVLKIARACQSAILSAQRGYLSEYMMTGLKGLMLKQAEDDIEQATKEAVKTIKTVNVTGSNIETVTVSVDKLSKDFDPTAIGYKLSENGQEWIISSSQQKVDAELILDEKGNNEKISASIKNANLYNGYDVSLVSSAPLLNLLVTQDGDFVNHYLNLVSSHRGTNGSDLGGQLSAARHAVKVAIFWEALSGVEGRATADIFIITNNKNTKRPVQVYNISTLASKAIEDFDKYVDITTSSGGTIDDLYFSNSWNVDSAAGRISQLLTDVHATKIKAGLKPSIFLDNQT